MKLQEKVNKIKRSESFKEGKFKIAATAKAFDVLSNSLYTNKIAAIIRELSCNAFDSHIDAKKETVPFKVHLPNSQNREFKIRDFGTGIKEEDIYNIYTTYFTSTKTDSNDFVGCLGLGSKTPFSYTDNFTVTSYYLGKKYTYSAFKSETGEPSIVKMNEIDTDEPNGLEIQFAVRNEDFSRFQREAARIYKWFELKPDISGAFVSIPKIIKESKGNGWFIERNSLHPAALMGNVLYKISVSEIKEQLEEEYVQLLDEVRPTLIFPIGALDVAPSRETLDYKKRTIKALKKRIDNIKKDIEKYVDKEIKKAESSWEAALQLQKLNSGELGKYISSLSKSQAGIKWKGKTLRFKYDCKEITGTDKREPNLGHKFWFESNWIGGEYKLQTKYRSQFFTQHTVDPSVLYVFVDTNQKRKFSQTRFRAWMRGFKEKYKKTTFRIFISKDQKFFNKIIKNLDLIKDKHYHYWHDMPKAPKKKNVGGGGGRKLTESKLLSPQIYRYYGNKETCWGLYENVDLEEGEGYYIGRTGKDILFSINDSGRNPDELSNLLLKWNNYAKTPISVHSFTPTQLKKKGKGWKLVTDFFHKKVPELLTEEIKRNIFYRSHLVRFSQADFNLIKSLLDEIPELKRKPYWENVQEKPGGLLKEKKEESVITAYNRFAKRYCPNKKITFDTEKFKNEINTFQTSIDQIKENNILLKLVSSNYSYYGNYKLLKEWNDIVLYIKTKNGLK